VLEGEGGKEEEKEIFLARKRMNEESERENSNKSNKRQKEQGGWKGEQREAEGRPSAFVMGGLFVLVLGGQGQRKEEKKRKKRMKTKKTKKIPL